MAVFVGVTGIYASVFLLGWNNDFPTWTEMVLWRTASLIVILSLLAYVLITEYTFRWRVRLHQHFGPREDRSFQQLAAAEVDLEHRGGFLERALAMMHNSARHIRNNSVSRDPTLNLPLKAALSTYLVGSLYCVARAYIIISDLVELRLLPATSFSTVEWLEVWPHA